MTRGDAGLTARLGRQIAFKREGCRITPASSPSSLFLPPPASKLQTGCSSLSQDFKFGNKTKFPFSEMHLLFRLVFWGLEGQNKYRQVLSQKNRKSALEPGFLIEETLPQCTPFFRPFSKCPELVRSQ
jgi:hypothetical protein